MSVEQQVEALKRDGYLIIERLFSEEFCDRAVAALHRIQAEHDIRPSDHDFSGKRTIRIMNMLQYDDFFQEIPVHPGYLPIIRQYMDHECLLSGIDSSEVLPGEKEQALHTDTWWHDDLRLDFPITVQSLLALTDFTEANGATRIVPGSHLWTADKVAYDMAENGPVTHLPAEHIKGAGTDWKPIVAEAPKGSVILFDSRLVHGAGANLSDKARPSIISPFCRGWIRQLDNFAYAIPQERLRTFSPELQKLVGLEMYRGGYGGVNNQNPNQWLWERQLQQA